MPLSERFYLADAVFVAAVEGEADLLAGLHAALRAPVYPPFLGRRSCPPAQPVDLGLHDGLDLLRALHQEPWQASAWYRRQHREEPVVKLPVLHEAGKDDTDTEVLRDQPLSFAAEHRRHSLRTVVRREVAILNPSAARAGTPHRQRPGTTRSPRWKRRAPDVPDPLPHEHRPFRRPALLSSPQALHAAVMSSFPDLLPTDAPEADGPRVLWRLDHHARAEAMVFLVSPTRPDLTHIVEQAGGRPAATPDNPGWQTRPYAPLLDRLAKGDHWSFRLTANPVHHIRRTADEPRKRTAHLTPVHQMVAADPSRQERAGFRILEKPDSKRLLPERRTTSTTTTETDTN
ncbi:hypothetical protein SBADM41S_03773 [Streptomyces badius]